MKIYAVTESELSIISYMNINAMTSFSAGSFFLSIAVTIFLDLLVLPRQITGETPVMARWVSVISLLLCLIFYVWGWFSLKKKKTNLDRIQSETETN